MNTSALKAFAQQARQLLRESVERRMIYWGFDAKGNNSASVEAVKGGYTFRGKVSDDVSVSGKWNKLKAAISKTSFDEVVEKASYTWFNRLLAIKILSKNGYETAQIDYLSDETKTPAILERARRGQYFFLNNAEQQRLKVILTDYEKEQDAFAILLIGYCHQHPLLQGIFGSIDDYTELLLPDDILTENGFLYFLNTTDAITEEDYKQVELIGWLYQFYISEKKDEVFAGFKKNKKAESKDIPAATQIFTPNWIVKYLVQNTLGRTWLDAYPDSELKKQWKYLVESSEQKKSATPAFLSLETLNFLDPAVGSGHILVEAFDTYYPMYLAEFYNPEEAVQSILQNNLFGLDLDTRAAQLAQFAIIIKAAKCSRTVLQGKILPHVYAMPQPRFFTKEEVEIFLGDAYISIIDELYEALQIMEQANNLGSIMILKLSDAAHKAIQERDYYWQTTQTQTLEEEIVKETFSTYINILIILTNEFVCIAANPPYMGQKNMNASLKSYVNKNYPLTKSDLFAVFMDVTTNLAKENGRHGIINMQSWMFLSSYEKLREELIKNQTIESMLHLGPRTFEELSGEVVQNTSFILKKTLPNNSCGVYYRLVEYGSNDLKKEAFRNKSNEFADIYQLNFLKITGYPIAYWITEAGLKCFEEHQAIKEIMKAAVGLNTGDNDVFLKLWPEIDFDKIDFKRTSIEDAQLSKSKWFPYNKGGGFKKWYGNLYYVLNWFNDGKEVKEFAVLRNDGKHWSRYIQNLHYMFKDGITWSDIVSNSFAARYTPKGSLFDVKGSSGFTYSEEDLLAVLSVFCSKLSSYFVKAVNPTITVQVGDLSRIPLPQMILKNYRIKSFASSCIELTKSDWDSRENSWDFRANPLILSRQKTLELSSIYWIKQISKNFFQLHSHEEELNKILINIYDLSSELSCDVSLNDITVLQDELDFQRLAQLRRPYENQLVPIRVHTIMQQLISYAVGCYMGRYRLDRPGLYIAHPSPTEEELLPYALSKDVNKHFLFQIDDDAIIPLMGSNGNFTDDMLHRTKEFLSIVWGNDTLTANLNFLQQQLGKDLEDYLLKDFWKDHVKTYSKKPIYWLFASKKGAFQVLVYMHRMNAYTPANIRSKYLIPHISWLKSQLIDMGKKAATLSKAELKKLDILRKQAAECEEYDLLLKDLADKQISFDLDDGVTKNYALFEGVVAPIK